MIEPLFNAFATTAFFEFVVFAIFEMRYLLSVWRARRANALDPLGCAEGAVCAVRALLRGAAGRHLPHVPAARVRCPAIPASIGSFLQL